MSASDNPLPEQCACRRVKFAPIQEGDGTTSEAWRCGDCGSFFVRSERYERAERVFSGYEAALLNLVDAIDCLMAESQGVYGLHLNGDGCPWDHLGEDGHMSTWLGDAITMAREALRRKE